MTGEHNRARGGVGASCPRMAQCWEAVVAAGRTGLAIDPSLAEHIEQCPACRQASVRARPLGETLGALANRIAAEAAGPRLSLRGDETAALLIRLARYESWRRSARRACAASVGVAAGLALFWAVLTAAPAGTGPKEMEPSLVDRAGPLVDDDHEARVRENPLSPAVASAIPVHGWVGLPSRSTSADSSLWWVVLSYGGHR